MCLLSVKITRLPLNAGIKFTAVNQIVVGAFEESALTWKKRLERGFLERGSSCHEDVVFVLFCDNWAYQRES